MWYSLSVYSFPQFYHVYAYVSAPTQVHVLSSGGDEHGGDGFNTHVLSHSSCVLFYVKYTRKLMFDLVLLWFISVCMYTLNNFVCMSCRATSMWWRTLTESAKRRAWSSRSRKKPRAWSLHTHQQCWMMLPLTASPSTQQWFIFGHVMKTHGMCVYVYTYIHSNISLFTSMNAFGHTKTRICVYISMYTLGPRHMARVSYLSLMYLLMYLCMCLRSRVTKTHGTGCPMGTGSPSSKWRSVSLFLPPKVAP